MPPRRACDICFKRKIQCAIPSPGVPCNWCSHQNIACTFEREPKRKKQDPATSNAIRELHRRIQQLEGDLVQKNTHDPAQITKPRSNVNITSPGTEQVESPHSHYSSNNTVHSSSPLKSLALRLFKQYCLFKPIKNHRANGEATAPFIYTLVV
ncbi:hypothetical protein VDGE_30134 [Verticillium dahliae]|uniref:Zn(2)-C6 fungal-type domain-containing protein n=1 Tax=Verticillium dahliae TaxID=27337 RepID=A0A444RND7_VERDA|nr:hypothetical protein VDGE_30134 [Verticillium dahliae]